MIQKKGYVYVQFQIFNPSHSILVIDYYFIFALLHDIIFNTLTAEKKKEKESFIEL